MREPNVITIQERPDGIFHVSDTDYGSSTTTGTFADALDWAVAGLGVGQPITIRHEVVS